MKTFILIKRNFYKYIAWFEISPSDEQNLTKPKELRGDIKLYNSTGGHNFLLSDDEVLEIVHSKNWDFANKLENRKKTTEYQRLLENSINNNFSQGWIDPQGKMYYCEYTDHDAFIHIVLGKTVKEIEKLGWLRIYNGLQCVIDKRITQSQANALRNMGVDVNDEDVIYYT